MTSFSNVKADDIHVHHSKVIAGNTYSRSIVVDLLLLQILGVIKAVLIFGTQIATSKPEC